MSGSGNGNGKGKDGRQLMSVRSIEGQLMPEEVTYQARLRAAMSGIVKEADVEEVVKQIVTQAKEGKRDAQKMFFEYLVGVKNSPKKIEVHNHYPDVASAARAEKAKRSPLSSRINGDGDHDDD